MPRQTKIGADILQQTPTKMPANFDSFAKFGLSWKRGKSPCRYCCTFSWFRHQLHHHHHHHHHQDQARQKRNTSWHDNVTQKKKKKTHLFGQNKSLAQVFHHIEETQNSCHLWLVGSYYLRVCWKKEPSNSPETHSKRSKASWKTCRDLEEKNCVCSKLKWLPKKCPSLGKKRSNMFGFLVGNHLSFEGITFFGKWCQIGVAFHGWLFGFELPQVQNRRKKTAKMSHRLERTLRYKRISTF